MLLATPAANVGRLSEHAQRLLRPIATSGSAVLAIEGMDGIGRSYAKVLQLYVGTWLHLSFLKNARGSRLDGQYGTGAVLSDVAGLAFVTRGKDYSVLDHPLVQARLHLPPDQIQQRPESQVVRSLYDCESVPVGPEGVLCRVVVATHPAGNKKSPVGVTRAGVVYELFWTSLPQQAFTASDVVELYLHRGAFEPQLADEDQEIDPDRWCSHTAYGQEAWCIVSQWVWNLRLELGHQVEPTPVRTVSRLLPPSRSLASRLPPPPLPHRGMARRPRPPPGKRGAFLVKTFLSSPTERSVVPQESLFIPRSGVEKPTAACAWCMRLASATAARVRCVSSVNGMAARPRSRARSASCSIRFAPVPSRCSGAIGTAEHTGAPVSNSCDTNAWKSACRHLPPRRQSPWT